MTGTGTPLSLLQLLAWLRPALDTFASLHRCCAALLARGSGGSCRHGESLGCASGSLQGNPPTAQLMPQQGRHGTCRACVPAAAAAAASLLSQLETELQVACHAPPPHRMDMTLATTEPGATDLFARLPVLTRCMCSAVLAYCANVDTWVRGGRLLGGAASSDFFVSASHDSAHDDDSVAAAGSCARALVDPALTPAMFRGHAELVRDKEGLLLCFV